MVAFGSEEQEGTEKLAGDKIDDEGWERGKNAADDQVFLSTRRFYRILPHIIPQRRMNRQMIFQGSTSLRRYCVFSERKIRTLIHGHMLVIRDQRTKDT